MLKKIKIKNFKSIKNIDIDLKNINILIGPNGSGKSNFISFFRMIEESFLGSDNLNKYFGYQNDIYKIFNFDCLKTNDPIKSTIIFNDELKKKWNNVYDFSIFPINNMTNISLFESLASWDTSYYKEYKLFQIHNKEKEKSVLSQYYDKEILEKLINSIQDPFNHIKNKISNISYYHFHDVSKNALMVSPSDIKENEFNLDKFGNNLSNVLYQLKNKKNHIFEQIKSAIKNIAPYFYDFSFDIDQKSKSKIKACWLNKKYSKWEKPPFFDLSDFSDGTIRFLSLTTLLLSSDHKTILLDEPELGLHPYAIESLNSLIKFSYEENKNQIIMATQSPLLLKGYGIENILVCDYIGDETKITNLDKVDIKSKDLFKKIMDEGDDIDELWLSNLIGGNIKW